MTEYTPTLDEVRECFLPYLVRLLPHPDQSLNISNAEYSRLSVEALDRFLAAHDAEVAANALREARDGWSEGLPNNGYYEYTSDSDCDGSNPRYFRRMPGAVIEPTTWETCRREEWQAAVDADRIEREAADRKSSPELGSSDHEGGQR